MLKQNPEVLLRGCEAIRVRNWDEIGRALV